jgi:EmrB/QacA subfamily drug resistance transporter
VPILVLLGLAQFMVILDVSVVNLALPDMATDLGLTGAQLTWVATAYTVSLGGLLLLGGRLADLFGRRRMFLIGLIAFTLASAAAGLATGPGTILAARGVQGVGAALLSPAALAILTTTFSGAARTRALAVWGAIGGGGAAVGVLLGGLLTTGPGWEWVFLVNVPVGLAVAAMTTSVVPSGRSEAASRRIDVPGAVLVTAATGTLVFGLVRLSASATRTSAFVALAVAAALWGLFVAVERRAARPLIDPHLVRQRPVVVGVATMLTGTALLVAAFFLGSLLMQRLYGMSALRTGLAFLPVAVGTVAGAHLAGRLMANLGPRIVGGVGFVASAAGLALLAAVSGRQPVWTAVVPGLVLAATGLGAILVTATTTALATVDESAAGVVSGTVNTSHELGAAVGTAAMSAIAGVGAGVIDFDGFRGGFAVASVVALAAAMTLPALLPRRAEVGDRRIMVH